MRRGTRGRFEQNNRPFRRGFGEDENEARDGQFRSRGIRKGRRGDHRGAKVDNRTEEEKKKEEFEKLDRELRNYWVSKDKGKG